MDVQLGIAGLLCLALAIGHTTVGVVWVLPSLTEERLPRTPFGPPSMSLSMVRVTWFVVTIFALGMGGLLLSMAVADHLDAKTLLLRWLAGMWLAATAMVFWVAPVRRDNLREFLRLPVPVLWVAVAVLCWTAST